MNKRKKEAVIRFRRYNKDAEPSHWYRAKLMLYYPWYDEDTDLLGGYATYVTCHAKKGLMRFLQVYKKT